MNFGRFPILSEGVFIKISLVLFFGTLIMCGYGYIHNIVNLYQSTQGFCGKTIVQYLGIVFPPLGVVLGWV
jgi:hypothetical protein